MQRSLVLLFGAVAYGVFFATFLYLIAFVGNLQQGALGDAWPTLRTLVPHSIDAGRDGGPLALAVAINLGLVLLFGLQHSVMARSGFKSWLKTKLPPAAERSVYVLLASLMLALLFWHWRPMPQVLWQATSLPALWFGWTVFVLGFALVLVSTFLIDHFELFGLRQSWSQWRGRSPAAPRFVTPWLYRRVRHPLYAGFLLAFWGGPVMSAGHLLFAAAMSAYILVAIRFEERDLVRQLGDAYVRYRAEVPMLLPRPLPRRAPAPQPQR